MALIRVRGPAVGPFVRQHLRAAGAPCPHSWPVGAVRRAQLVAADGQPLDELLVTVHARKPEWDLRLHLHGSRWLVAHCTRLLRGLGFRRRREQASTLWPSANAVEAEGYALLPRLLTARGADWLLRQMRLLPRALARLGSAAPSERARRECRAIAARRAVVEWFSRPLRVALVGAPNVGKSSLANALADRPLSLVAPTPGTTRDWLEIPGEACGFPVVWLDTAGLRAGGDQLEAAAAARARMVTQQADAALVVIDVTPAAARPRAEFLAECQGLRPAAVALNKCDGDAGAGRRAWRSARAELPPAWRGRAVTVSAHQRAGLEQMLIRLLEGAGRREEQLLLPAAFTDRQAGRLRAAAAAPGRNRFRECLASCLGAPPAS